MKFPIFVNNNISIRLNVYQCGMDESDANVYIIDQGTELIVETKHAIEKEETVKKLHYVKTKLEKLSLVIDKIDLSHLDECDDDRFVYLTSDIASEIGVANGDLVQLLNLIFIRTNIVKDETEPQEQKSPLESMKEFEEKKERVCIVK